MKKPGLLFASLLALLLLAASALARPTIVIDPGHGGYDRGGVPGQIYAEKIYTLDVAKRLNAKLQTAGFKTVMTRNGDYFVTLGGRCAVANRLSNAVFISVHFNSGAREGAAGIETYYYNSRSAAFAREVHRQLVPAAGTEDRHVRQRGFYVIRNTRCPAVLAECGFLTNRAEGQRISTASHRDKLATALARAIVNQYR